MGLSGIRPAVSLVILLVSAGLTAASTDDHAVTGAVLSNGHAPIQNVLVTVLTKYGDPITSSRTDIHGKYLVTIPNPPQQYFIHYRHDDYLEDIEGDFENNGNHILDDVILTPATISNNINLEQLNSYVNQLVELGKRGREARVLIFDDVAQRNLEKLIKAYAPTSEAGARVRTHMQTELVTIKSWSQQSNPLNLPDAIKPLNSPDATKPSAPAIFSMKKPEK